MLSLIAGALFGAQAPTAAVPPPGSNTAEIAAARTAADEIARLEQQWGAAFVARDFDFIERIVAPEYRLVVAGDDGEFAVSRRGEWLKNARAFTHQGFTVETVDVNYAGDTAVASAKGVWTVAFQPGAAPMPIRFFVTDTWVRRPGAVGAAGPGWQVIHRYSHRLAGPAAASGKSPERGR